MKITKLEIIHAQPFWNILKVSTDEGIYGVGEPLVEGRARTVATAVDELGDMIIGKDPLDIARLWELMYKGTFYRGGPVFTSAVSGVEQALWDIAGKYHNMPVYKLLGGKVRDKIRLYAWIHGETVEKTVENAKQRVAQGFTSIKMTAAYGPLRIVETPETIGGMADRIGAVREAIGKSVDLGVDFHGRFSPANAKLLIREIEQYKPMFVEEPVLPDNADVMASIAHSTYIPIATGERLFTRWGFKEILEKQAAQILQPDVCHAGGIHELLKIAYMGEVNYCGLAPHNPMGPVALAASFQVDACAPNFFIQEHSTLGGDRGIYLKEPFVQEDGYYTISDKPGLGIEVDWDRTDASDGRGHLQTWFNEDDGSFGEW
jgi:galactonate dehydratase